MKLLRLLAVASAAFFVVSSALAQTSGTVTNHAFAIGKGPGQTGFTSLLCAATQLAVGQTSANPACKTLSGDVTMDADGVTAIGANKVTNGMMRQSGALSVIGRSANSTGNVADISAVAGSGCAFREASNVVGCGELATAALGANIVTNAKLAQMANGTTKCRTTSGTGNAEDCTESQMRTLLSLVVGTNVQAWDADLDALAALTGTGIVRRTGSATFTTGTAVANSELATMTNNTFKGNVSGSTAVPSDITASQVLDAIGTTRGSLLYRGASSWAVRTPGTAGQVLTSNGAGADPTYQDAAGGGGASDTDRRNFLLSVIYQSKSLVGYRRLVNLVATGFSGVNDGANAINTGSSSNYSVTASPGYVAPTVGSATMISAGAGTNIGNMTGNGGLAGVFDGVTNQVLTGSGTRSGTSGYAGKNYASSPKKIDHVDTFGSSDNGYRDGSGGTVNLSLYGKNGGAPSSDTDGTLLGTASTTDSATNQQTISSSDTVTSWDYLWVRVTGSTTVVFAELQFYEPGTVNSMTIVTTAQTADTAVANGRVLLEYDNTATPTLDTDLTAEVTCNGGTNWASAALTAVTSNSQGGRKVAETADTACTSGTSFAARVKTLNSKVVPIYGLSLTVH